MSYTYDRREAAIKPLKLTDDEKKALTGPLGQMRGLNYSSFQLTDLKPGVLKSLMKKKLIHAEYNVRFTPMGYDVAENLP